jgi:hypothetical protein
LQPYEVIAAPYVCYLAPTTLTGPVGGFPNLDTAPPAPWTLVGTAGSKSYVNTGVTVSHTQTLGTFVPAGSPAVRKAWRQTEELTISFSIADMSPAQYALQLNNAAVVSQAASGGAPGDQHFEAMRGVLVQSFALLLRGISPFQEAYSAQYEVNAAYNAGAVAPVLSNQGPAVLAVEWHAYELVSGSLGVFRAANTP